MRIIHKKTYNPINHNNLSYTIFIVSDNERLEEIVVNSFRACVARILGFDEYHFERDGYQYLNVKPNNVHVYIQYEEVTPGKCALIASKLSKQYPEEITDMLWNSYCETLDKELMVNSK